MRAGFRLVGACCDCFTCDSFQCVYQWRNH